MRGQHAEPAGQAEHLAGLLPHAAHPSPVASPGCGGRTAPLQAWACLESRRHPSERRPLAPAAGRLPRPLLGWQCRPCQCGLTLKGWAAAGAAEQHACMRVEPTPLGSHTHMPAVHRRPRGRHERQALTRCLAAAVEGEGIAAVGPLTEVSQSMIVSRSGVEGGCLAPPPAALAEPPLLDHRFWRLCSSIPANSCPAAPACAPVSACRRSRRQAVNSQRGQC